jgi:hypothetical protein
MADMEPPNDRVDGAQVVGADVAQVDVARDAGEPGREHGPAEWIAFDKPHHLCTRGGGEPEVEPADA